MKRIPGMRPLYIEENGRLWASRGLKVYVSRDHGTKWDFVASFQGTMIQRISRMSRLLERFTRSGLQGLLPLSGTEFLATIRGSILKGSSERHTMREVFPMRRGSRPLHLCRVPDGRVYWGEYWFNQDREEVHIYVSEDGGESWQVAFTFPAGDIRHVHGIFYDEVRDGCWVLTGDDDAECRILFGNRDLERMHTVFSGAQRYRSVSLVTGDGFLLTGTDTPFERNYIQRLDPETGDCERVLEVEGSVFDVRRAAAFFVAAVTSEPSRINTSPYASLWISSNGRSWEELYRARRDAWQMPYSRIVPDWIAELPFFQHGAFVLPAGRNGEAVLYAYAQAIKGKDGELLVWDLPSCAQPSTMGS